MCLADSPCSLNGSCNLSNEEAEVVYGSQTEFANDLEKLFKKEDFGAYSPKILTLLVWGEVQESVLLDNSQVIWVQVFARTSENY